MRIISTLLAGSLAMTSYAASAQTETVNGLSIIINFANSTVGSDLCRSVAKQNFTTREQVDIARYINEKDFSLNGNMGSLKDYFWDNSRGKLDLDNTIVVVDLPDTRDHYECGGSDEHDIISLRAFGTEATQTADSYHAADLSGGPLSDLANDVNCRIFGGCAGVNIGYRVFNAAAGSFSFQTTPINSANLSRKRSEFTFDQLDEDEYLPVTPDRGMFIEHLSFFQMVTPGDSPNGLSGTGLWPRSIPSVNTGRHGLNNIALGRIQITPIGQLGAYSAGTMAHESGHTLFGLKDLYDTQGELTTHEGVITTGPINPNSLDFQNKSITFPNVDTTFWYESYGVADHSLMGSIGIPDVDPPLLNAQNRALAGLEDPIDITNAAEGETFTVDWQADGSDINRAPSFQYCRPASAVDECFYIEARVNGSQKNPAIDGHSLRSVSTPSGESGLLIWHTSYYASPTDFQVNQRKENSDNLHYSVELVEADGDSDLLSSDTLPVIKPNIHQGDYFSNNESFNGLTNPSSDWWDGNASGLSLRNIRRVGDTIVFEIGKRPLGEVYVDYNSSNVSVKYNGSSVNNVIKAPIGSSISLLIESLKEEDVNYFDSSDAVVQWRTNKNLFFTELESGNVSNNLVEVLVKPKKSILGVRGASGSKVKSLEIESKIPRNTILKNIFIYSPNEAGYAANYSGTMSAPIKYQYNEAEGGRKLLYLSPADDYRVTNWQAINTLENRSYRGSTEKVSFPITLNPNKLHVETELLPGKLCAEGNVSEWRWDAMYRGVGTKVRFNDVIYASNLPRNYIFENGAAYLRDGITSITPEDRPGHWTRLEVCGEYTAACSLYPNWLDEPNAERVVYGNKLWSNSNNETFGDNVTPGDFPLLANLYAFNVNGTFPEENHDYIKNSSNDVAKWRLEGNCNDRGNVSRAYIEETEGVTNLRTQRFTSIKDGHWKPWLTFWSSKSMYLYFDIAAGFELDDVYVDGVPQNLDSNDRFYKLYYPSKPRQAHYVEVRARPI